MKPFLGHLILAVACIAVLGWLTAAAQSSARKPVAPQVPSVGRPAVERPREEGLRSQLKSSGQTHECKSFFSGIQQEIATGNVAALSGRMGSQVYVNLRGGESGYYSASQARYLLENYLRHRRIASFTFSTIGESDENPYATGSATVNDKGVREIAQIYVSLSRDGDRWRISQISIY
jgi:hypothetical protein